MSNGYTEEKRIEKFWSRVNKTETCWIWTGAKKSDGYGHIAIFGYSTPVTHYIWYITYGEYPSKGKKVCHVCDTPLCVNPKHLFLGTDLDNARDRIAKGRKGSTGRPHKYPVY